MTLRPQAESVFFAALAMGDPAQRAEYLNQACGTDDELRRLVDWLLTAHPQLGSFLQDDAAGSPPHAGAATPQVGGATVDVPINERPGSNIGPYRLLQQIGEGGMGTVFMAEQCEPVRRKVALKVIKRGMDSKHVIARFEAERQALSMMDHVNIARVLDAGATEAGLPYFVMELVHGVPITKYCDDNHLTPRERLELFVPVCQAIQHAHQKGIIHRDIKPSNVMVTLYDGKPVSKVIDFGVAKAIEQKLTDRTLFTQYGNMVGTLEYMSPEQAEMSALGVDTRSDIYSLGVLLYELLTGSTPLTHKRIKEGAYAEILRMIKEEEPPRPSTRLSNSGEALVSISANRHTDPAKLTKLVRGELDWIVMKTLEKDRNRRYETTKDFVADVQRYLDDEQVLACPPSAGYRLRKFVRRNRLGLAMVGLVLFFLVLLGSGVGWAWRDRAARATEQANHLEQAVARAELLQQEGKPGEALAALERARLLAREAEPSSLLAERIESLRQLLDAEGRDEVFVAQIAAIRSEVQTELDIEKNKFNTDKGYPKIREALEHYGIAVGFTPPAAAVNHIQKRPAAIQTVVVTALNECLALVPVEDSTTRAWLIDVLQKADSDPWRDKMRRAWKQLATRVALVEDIDVRQQPASFLVIVADSLPIESPTRLDLARRVQFAHPGDIWANHQLGWVLHYGAGKYAEAVRYYTAALALRPHNPGELLNRAMSLQCAGELEAAIADLQRAVAVAPRYAAAHANLGDALNAQDKPDEAIAAYRKAIELDPKLALVYARLGNALRAQEKWDDATASFLKAIEIAPNCFAARHDLGKLLHARKKWPAAVASFHKALEIKPADAMDLRHLGHAARDRNYALAHYHLGLALRDQKKPDEAIAAFRKATELDPRLAEAYSNLGLALLFQGQAQRNQKKLDEAIVALRKVIELVPKDAHAYSNLGSALLELKKLDEAIAVLRKAIELDAKNGHLHYNLGLALHAQRKWDDATASFRKTIELDPKNANAYDNLGFILCDGLKQYDKAIECFRSALKLDPTDANARRMLAYALTQKGWDSVNNPDSKRRDPKRALDSVTEAIELAPKSEIAWQYLGWVHYRIGNWRVGIETLEKSCKLQKEGTGDAGQWIVLALAHAKSAALAGLPEKAREHHRTEARRRFDLADKQMDSWYRVRPRDLVGQATWDFRAEARELLGVQTKKK